MASEYTLVELRTFTFTSWKDTITLYNAVTPFDGIKVLNMNYTTPTTGNLTLQLAIVSNPEFNIGKLVASDGGETDYMFATILDNNSGANVYVENINPIIKLDRVNPTFRQFRYEIYINGLTADADITSSYPVTVEVGFFKRL